MSNIDTYLAKIMSAVYGEEVRGAIHDALYAMNEDLESIEEPPIFEGATEEKDGKKGLVPAPVSGVNNRYLRDDGVWSEIDFPDSKGVVSYSYEEQDTGMKWVDGSKIYQKTYYIYPAIEINSTGTAIDTAIDNLTEIYKVIRAWGVDDGSVNLQCCNIWFGVSNGWKVFCAEGMTATQITLQYTKRPSSSDAIFVTEGFETERCSGSIGTTDYMMTMWRNYTSLFDNRTNQKNTMSPHDNGGVSVWNISSTSGSTGEERIDGCDWYSYDCAAVEHDFAIGHRQFIPYCVSITPNSNNAWIPANSPYTYVEFSADGTNWDVLWEGKPIGYGGTDKPIYIWFDTDKTYSKVRLRFKTGSNYNNSPDIGVVGTANVYGKAPA